MGIVITFVLPATAVVAAAFFPRRVRATVRQRELDDAKAEASRWVRELGGQVRHLGGTNTAAKQALADAAERYHAAGSRLKKADSVEKYVLARETAWEGLYYVRAARIAMDMACGPALPQDDERSLAGTVTEYRQVDIEGQIYRTSPGPRRDTPHYYPGGEVAGRPVPEGWYSRPWWQPAVTGGAWCVGSAVVFGALFSGMAGIPDPQTWLGGHEAEGEPLED